MPCEEGLTFFQITFTNFKASENAKIMHSKPSTTRFRPLLKMAFFKVPFRQIKYLFLSTFIIFGQQSWGYGGYLLKNLADAETNIQAGPLKIHPGISMKMTQNDNIYTRPNKTMDTIYSGTGALLLGVGDRYSVNAGYAFDRNWFLLNPKEDYNAQHGFFRMNLLTNAGFFLKVKSSYVDTQDQRDRVDNPLRASHWANKAETQLGYESESKKFMAEIFHTHDYLYYHQSQNNALNQNNNTGGANLSYQIFSKTHLLGGYAYFYENYFERKTNIINNSNHKGTLGLKFDITDNFYLLAKPGYIRKTFQESTLGSADLWIIEGTIGYKVPLFGKTEFLIDGGRTINRSSYFGSTTQNIGLSSFYIENMGKAQISIQFTGKVAFFVSGTYRQRTYNSLTAGTLARSDIVQNYDTGITYAMQKWLVASILYSYMHVNSNDNLRTIYSNIGYLSVTMAF